MDKVVASGAIDSGSSPDRGTMEKPIIFKNKYGKQLMGVLHLPKGKGKFPLVVICPGVGGTKTLWRFVELARLLEKNKIACFRFDFEGHGDSEGAFEYITAKKEINDLRSAMNFILKNKKIDPRQISFVGHSFGAVIIACYLSQANISPNTLVFWAPAFNQKKLISIWNTKNDLRKWKKQGYLIRKDKKFGINYLRENETKNYSSLLDAIETPTLIIHGKKDETVSPKFSKELIKKYKTIKKLIIYPDAEHKFEDYYVQQKLIKDTTKWIKKYL